MMSPYPLPWGFGGVGMQFIMVTAWVMVFGAAYMLIRDLVRRRQCAPVGANHRASNRGILNRRLAAGDISKEEYDAIRRKLNE